MASIDLHGPITAEFTDTLRKGLNRWPAGQAVNIKLSSPGGLLDQGIVAYTLLANEKRPVHMELEGDVFSAGTLLLCAANHVDMPSNCLLMVHEPWIPIISPATMSTVSKQLSYLKATATQALNIYQQRTKQPRKRLRKMMQDETYLDAQDAMSLRLVDNVTGIAPVLNMASSDYEFVRDRDKLANMLGSRRSTVDIENLTTQLTKAFTHE